MLAPAWSTLRRIAAGELVFTAPAGLDAYLAPAW